MKKKIFASPSYQIPTPLGKGTMAEELELSCWLAFGFLTID